MTSRQEIYGRRGRVVTDQFANVITRVEELSYDLKVYDVMTEDVKYVSPDLPMADLHVLLRQEQISGAPVVSGNELVGVISIEDLIRSLSAQDIQSPVSKYMTHQVIAVNSFDTVIEAMKTFARIKVGRLPVIDEQGRLVGMITKGDITRGILIALERDYQAEEIRRYRASHLFEDINSDRTSLILRYHIKPRNFINGGNASSNIKRALIRLGASPQIARRCGIAIYEAEMNLVIHSTNGGIMTVEIEPHRILLKATDDGPGIPNVALALQPGYSTATEEIRELGFGAGMGLPNIKRCVDSMVLESAIGKGTVLEMSINLLPDESFRETSSYDLAEQRAVQNRSEGEKGS